MKESGMRTLLSLGVFLAFVTPALAAEPPAHACGQEQAITAATALPSTTEFCKQIVNASTGQCTFTARPPNAANIAEATALDLLWVVTATPQASDKSSASEAMPSISYRVFKPCQAFPVVGQSQAADGCSQDQAVATVRAEQKVKTFCSYANQGKMMGCVFSARPPAAENKDEMADTELAWLVQVAQVHSRDAQGKPLFMPEGNIFFRVDKACKIKP
jgi:hypothetical protein